MLRIPHANSLRQGFLELHDTRRTHGVLFIHQYVPIASAAERACAPVGGVSTQSSGAPFLVHFRRIPPPSGQLPNDPVRPLAVFARGLPEPICALIPSRACQSHASTSTRRSRARTTRLEPIQIHSTAATSLAR